MKNSYPTVLCRQYLSYIKLPKRIYKWRFAPFGTICKILKTWKTPLEECYFWYSCRLLKVTLHHGCFSRFLNCTNGTKSRNASHMMFRWQLHNALEINILCMSTEGVNSLYYYSMNRKNNLLHFHFGIFQPYSNITMVHVQCSLVNRSRSKSQSQN